jgi:long-subunit acyl-CoA synthetase (AMP-forming)
MHILVYFEYFILLKNIFIYLDESILKIRPDKKDIAVIMYTSGSTGTPKG